MRIKVSIDIEESSFRELALQNAISRVKMIRYEFAFRRNGIFNNPKQIPREHEIVFATLYEKLGYNTQAIEKFRSFRAKYLSEVKKVWVNYYAEISYKELNFRFWEEARIAKNRFSDLVYLVSECEKLIEKYRGKPILSVPYLLEKAFVHIQYGNQYSLALHLNDLGVSWIDLTRSPNSRYSGWIIKEFAKVKIAKPNKVKEKLRAYQ